MQIRNYRLPAFARVQQRRVVKTPKSYYFDVGVVNYLRNRRNLLPGSVDFGHALEHLIVQEAMACVSYKKLRKSLSYWRAASGREVDLVYGDAEVAVEIKSTLEVQSHHMKGLQAFAGDYPAARKIIVSLDAAPRVVNGVEVMPAVHFLKAMWNDEIFT